MSLQQRYSDPLGGWGGDLESICFSDNLFQLLKIFKEAEGVKCVRVCLGLRGTLVQTKTEHSDRIRS